MLCNFLNNYRTTLAQQRDRVNHYINAKRWKDLLDSELNKQIVPRGMTLLVEQLALAKENTHNKPCSSAFTTVHGIPCYHEIRTREPLHLKITKNDFHSHWHFQRQLNGRPIRLPPPPQQQPQPIIFEPNIVRTRGRPRRDNTTRRDSSSWEMTQAATQPRIRPGRVGGATSRAKSSPAIVPPTPLETGQMALPTVGLTANNSDDEVARIEDFEDDGVNEDELLAALETPAPTTQASTPLVPSVIQASQPAGKKRGRPKGTRNASPETKRRKQAEKEAKKRAREEGKRLVEEAKQQAKRLLENGGK